GSAELLPSPEGMRVPQNRVRGNARGQKICGMVSTNGVSPMADERTAPIFFFAPFVSSTMRVEPSWIDYNGHMNMAYYHVLFDRAVEEGFGVVGLGQDYMEARNASYFAAEVHTLYKRELKLGDEVRITLQLVDFDEKRLHFYMEIRHVGEGWVAAT